ncbi:IS110 family transposase [Parashewanella spongiae]|uniref:IS110 family transposase n=1 Tax=Parashewanella spongiae TaxID=342950 RepID=UPI00105A39DD|nr:IS110 family transposase [Parashewanella spongiae]
MSTVLQVKDNAKFVNLYIAFELSSKTWKLGFSNGEKKRVKTIDSRDWKALHHEIALAKEKLFCVENCKVISCYEAGRDGFWIHRALIKDGIENHVIDSASIEVSRKQKKVKTDRVDVIALLRLLMRYHSGEQEALNIINVPNVEAEDKRRINRERERLVKERGSHSARIKSLLCLHGISVENISKLKGKVNQLKTAVLNKPLPTDLVTEIERELDRHEIVDKQIKAIEKLQKQRVLDDCDDASQKINQLMQLKGVGWQSSWVLVTEFFHWREFKNAKQVGACAGMTPTPYDSGDSQREQGICKSGNRRIRKIMVELSWFWLRYQPKSELSLWFEQRFAHGSKRMRRIGIVAMARKLLIKLWKYLEHGEVPSGATMSL